MPAAVVDRSVHSGANASKLHRKRRGSEHPRLSAPSISLISTSETDVAGTPNYRCLDCDGRRL